MSYEARRQAIAQQFYAPVPSRPWWLRLRWWISPRCGSAYFPGGPPFPQRPMGCSRKRDHSGSHRFDLPVNLGDWSR